MKLHCKLLATILFFTIAAVASCQTPSVKYKSTAHYRERTKQFQKEPMIKHSDIVMFGNSLTEFGGDWNKRIPESDGTIINRGIKGDDSRGMLNRLNQITPYAPKKIFVGCGINDVSHDLSVRQVATKVQRLLRTMKRQTPESKIYYFSLLPINESFNRWKTLAGRTDDVPLINARMKEWCDNNGITYIDVFSHLTEPGTNVLRKELSVDGLHLTEAGYAIWVDCIKDYFKDVKVEKQ